MGLCEELAGLGANVNEALERLCNDEELYIELLTDLLDDFKEYEVKEPLMSDDIPTATLNAHSLKGVTGNLGLTPLFEQYKKINDFLKEQNVDEAEIVLEATLPLQQKFVDVIQRYSA